MKTSVTTNGPGSVGLLKSLPGILAGGLLLGLAAGCATNRQVTKESYYQPSGFLGDYSELHRGAKGQARLVYIRPGVDWSQYTQIWIQPVELWKSDDPDSPLGKLSPANQQKLINLYNTAMYDTLSKNFTMVDHGGPGVLIVHAAITDARKSRPVAGLVSGVYVPLKVISIGKQTLLGTGIGVGMVTIEAELLDGQTGERLAAVVDSRSGTTAIRSKVSGTFGDIERSFNYWAQRLDTRLMEEKENSPTKTPL
jgi:Protein of unknown function (DUF3313)